MRYSIRKTLAFLVAATLIPSAFVGASTEICAAGAGYPAVAAATVSHCQDAARNAADSAVAASTDDTSHDRECPGDTHACCHTQPLLALVRGIQFGDEILSVLYAPASKSIASRDVSAPFQPPRA